jgi:Putative adhesin
MGSRMLTGAVGVLGVVTLAGCGFVPNKSFRDEQTLEPGIGAVTLVGDDGSVTITGSSDASVHVKRHVRYRDNHKPGATDSVAGNTLTLNTSCGRACWVDYDLTVPRATTVSGRNGSGDVTLRDIASVAVAVGSGEIRVRGATGNVSARANSGDLDLSGVAGAVVCHTGSGDIRLANITGTADAETGSGDVVATGLSGGHTSAHTGSGDLTLRLSATQDVDADTGSGDVRVTVPAGQAYHVTADTSSGDRHVGVTDDPAAAHRLKVHTGSGDITVNAG